MAITRSQQARQLCKNRGLMVGNDPGVRGDYIEGKV